MSTTFLDGPAKGVSLQLRRAPIMLRVTRRTVDHGQSVAQWDALDQLDDVAKPEEAVYVYVMVRGTHVRAMQRPGGCFESAVYRHLPAGPRDSLTSATVRDNARWSEWCEAHRAELTEHYRNSATT